jgi:uncharacterized protein (DUF427 family)
MATRRSRSARLNGGMTAGHTVTITPTDSLVEVHLGTTVLAKSNRALRVEETGLPARFYLPKDDVRMDLLRPTTFETACPFKGIASYWSATVDGETHDGLVWGYETPIDAAADIAGYVSFYPHRAAVLVDGEILAG